MFQEDWEERNSILLYVACEHDARGTGADSWSSTDPISCNRGHREVHRFAPLWPFCLRLSVSCLPWKSVSRAPREGRRQGAHPCKLLCDHDAGRGLRTSRGSGRKLVDNRPSTRAGRAINMTGEDSQIWHAGLCHAAPVVVSRIMWKTGICHMDAPLPCRIQFELRACVMQ